MDTAFNLPKIQSAGKKSDFSSVGNFDPEETAIGSMVSIIDRHAGSGQSLILPAASRRGTTPYSQTGGGNSQAQTQRTWETHPVRHRRIHRARVDDVLRPA
jgi:hypothetical protein